MLIALLDPDDTLHLASVEALSRHAEDDLQIPASAYSESLVGPAQRGDLRTAKRAVASLLVEIVPLTDQIAERAAELRSKHAKLKLPDALVIATGSVLNADVILTGDSGWRQLASTIQVL